MMKVSTVRIRFSNPRRIHCHRIIDTAQITDIKPFNPHTVDQVLPKDEPALIAALILKTTKRLGRGSDVIPRIVHEALADLVTQGSPTARLLYAWLDHEKMTADGIMIGARQPDTWRTKYPGSLHSSSARVYRHRRFWRPNSPRLAELDKARVIKLQALLLKELSHEH